MKLLYYTHTYLLDCDLPLVEQLIHKGVDVKLVISTLLVSNLHSEWHYCRQLVVKSRLMRHACHVLGSGHDISVGILPFNY